MAPGGLLVADAVQHLLDFRQVLRHGRQRHRLGLEVVATHGLGHQFHDLKKEGVSAERLATWCSTAGLDKVLNRKGTTWRGLTPTQQESAGQLEHALALMQANTSLIKRPIVEWDSETEAQLTVGFSPETWMKHIQPGAK